LQDAFFLFFRGGHETGSRPRAERGFAYFRFYQATESLLLSKLLLAGLRADFLSSTDFIAGQSGGSREVVTVTTSFLASAPLRSVDSFGYFGGWIMWLGRHFAIAFLLTTVAPLPSVGHASDRLQGAWVIDGAPCSEVFTQRGGRIALKRNLPQGWSAFIVNGKHVLGASATCDLISSKRKGDVESVLLGCKSQIMFGSMSVSLRFLTDDKFVRLDPEFPEIGTTYNRCAR
jgi:hypothetical protein